jgi:hypothetical protein
MPSRLGRLGEAKKTRDVQLLAAPPTESSRPMSINDEAEVTSAPITTLHHTAPAVLA